MTDANPGAGNDLAYKIARLVEERGWNQEDFARITNLNRQTVHHILHANGERRLRNATVGACARALGVTVSELRFLPLEQLLPRMHQPAPPPGERAGPRPLDETTDPEVVAWLEENPGRAQLLTPREREELLSLQGTGGPLTRFAVQQFVEQLERQRRLAEMVQAVAGTEYLDLLEQLVTLIFEKIQPYRDRK